MEMRHLQHFLALAEEGQFTAAARKVHVVQSGLSTSIKELEAELGVRLVERTTRRVALTPAGELFLEHARGSLAMLQEGLEAVRAQSRIVRGPLRIGILQSLHPYIDLPAILHSFHKRYPEVEFTITSPPVDRAPDLVRSGALDLAFHPEHTPMLAKGLLAHRFTEDYLVAIVSAVGERSARSAATTLEDLVKVPFVDLVAERALRKVVDRAFSTVAAVRESRYEVSEIESLLDFVASGLGVALVPSLLGRSAAQSRRVKVLTLAQRERPLPVWKLVVLTRQGKTALPSSAPLALFLSALLKRRDSRVRPDQLIGLSN